MFFNISLTAQDEANKKLYITYNSDFQSYPSYPVYCLDDFYTDSRGKIWISTCLLNNLSSTGLLSFDGYKFEKPILKNNTLTYLEKNYIGIYNDKIFGYSNLDTLSYLFFYDTQKNRCIIYDTIYIEKPQVLFDNVNLQDKASSVFQRLENNIIYTYIRDSNTVQLCIYDDKLNKVKYKFQSLPQYSSNKLNSSFNTNKEWYFMFDYTREEIRSLNLITGKQKYYEIKVDDQQLPINPFKKNTKIEWQEGYLIIMIPSNNRYYRYVFKAQHDKIHFVDKYDSYSGKSIFLDSLGQKIIYKKKQSKNYLELTTENDQVYNISEINDILESNVIQKIYSKNFLNKLYILTDRGFHVVKLGKRNAIEKINTNSPVRGIEMIDDKHLIYLKETGINQVHSIHTDTGQINLNPEVCAFNRLKLLRRDDKIWGIQQGDFASYDTTSKLCKTYKVNQNAYLFQFDNNGHIIYMDTKGEFWKYHIDTGEVDYLNFNLSKIEKYPTHLDFMVDDNDILWIVNPLGLFKYDLNLNTFERINEKVRNFNYSLISIAKGKNDELWLGSLGSGLIIFDTKSYKFKTFDTQDGLPNNTVASITQDNNCYYWVGTYKGVAVFDSDAKLKANLYESDGLINNESNRHASALLADGRIAIGTINGISLIYPERITSEFEEDLNLKTYFTSINYYDAEHQRKTSIKHGFKDLNKIVLPPDNKNINIEFANSNYINPSKNIYAYKIEGLHEDWISLGTNNKLALSSLPSGNHVLKVKSSDGKGNWSKNVLELNIVVEFFFYYEIWFYILLLVFFISISFFVILLLNKKIKKATQKINEDKNRIENQAEKLKTLDKAKGEFFTNITHEFRTPLTIIKGITQVLKDKYAKDSPKEFNDLEQNSNHLIEMVDQILDLRKLESNQLKFNLFQADLCMFINYIVDSHQYLAQQKQIKLEVDVEDRKIIMDFDPEKLRIVISNLITNAIKYTESNGLVSVNVKQDEALNAVVITIKDNGVGFSYTELKKAFELFYQSDSIFDSGQKGSGVGLYYAKKLIELMEGTIDIKSEKGEGTSIQISLSISNKAKKLNIESKIDDYLSSSQVLKEGLKNKTKHDCRLLIVDDNVSVRDLLRLQLESKYDLSFANDGDEALEKAISLGPDLIISDVMMPRMDGFELCQALKTNIQTSHIPIILLTAKVDQESIIKGLESGVDIYLKKPFDYKELLINIQNLINSRKKLQKKYKGLLFEKGTTENSKEDDFILEFKRIVLKNLEDSSFNISELCKTLKISRAGLHNKIKALTGLSTTYYINHIKIYKAKELLEDKTINISQVSYKVGILDSNYFSRLFKKEFGMSPSEYRESLMV